MIYINIVTAAAAKSPQSCPTLCDPIDSSPPGSPSLGFSRQEHWSGLPFPTPMHESEKGKWSRSVVSNSSRTPWTAAHQAPPSMGFTRQEYWSGVPLPSPIYMFFTHSSFYGHNLVVSVSWLLWITLIWTWIFL